MFVGGPNERTDFHVDESSEFFYQLQGNIQLPIIEGPDGHRRVIDIREGDVFLLPSRIPHSPQRPEQGSVGFVLERARNIPAEYDCMRWYSDFNTCDKVEFEKFFHCNDLAKDLVPIAAEYALFCQRGRQRLSPEEEVSMSENVGISRTVKPIQDNRTAIVPEPFNLRNWIDERRDRFCQGTSISLFGSTHPDKEFDINISSLEEEIVSAEDYEVMVWQLEGQSTISGHGVTCLDAGMCMVFPLGSMWTINRSQNACSITMVIHCDPLGNK
jgi:3-hydroxyanthranilate 3,4-dioxygenase